MLRTAAARLVRSRLAVQAPRAPRALSTISALAPCAGSGSGSTQDRARPWLSSVALAATAAAAVYVAAAPTTTASCSMNDVYTAQELGLAALRGDTAHVQQLLNRGAAVNARHRGGWTALHVAAVNGHDAVVDLLLARGADVNAPDQYTPESGRGAMRARTVEFSAAVNPLSPATGFTPLHYAVLMDNAAVVSRLLAAGADPTRKDATGETAAAYTDSAAVRATLESAAAKFHETRAAAAAARKAEEKRQRRANPLEQRVKEFIVGQEGPVGVVAAAVRRRENGWHDNDHPLVFMFLGSSGVGKTELAKRLAAYLHPENRAAFIRVDMSEYMEKHEAAKLIGAPPGYVGHDQGGQLTALLRQCPDAVVLFDEVEKAHVDVLNVLLQLFDEGRLTDGQGHTVDCRNAIFVMTSNVGADLIAEYGRELRDTDGGSVPRAFKDEVMRPVLRRHFPRDEFLGRIDEIVYFLPFSDAELRSLTQMELAKWAARARTRHGIELTWTPEVVELLLADYDVHYGARSLQHAVNRHVVNHLAAADEAGKLPHNSKVSLLVVDGRVTLDISSDAADKTSRGWFS